MAVCERFGRAGGSEYSGSHEHAGMREGFRVALSLVSGRGGQPTPVRAAQWFARHGGASGIPAGGWREIRREGSSALAASGPVTVHVVQGRDRLWQVDSGEGCAGPRG